MTIAPRRGFFGPAAQIIQKSRGCGPARFDYIVVVGGLMQEQEYLDLAHALLLLSRSARSVTQVAQDCGFVEVSHLIRVFKTTHGITAEV